MHPITMVLASLVALEHLYIFYLESLVPQSRQTAKVQVRAGPGANQGNHRLP